MEIIKLDIGPLIRFWHTDAMQSIRSDNKILLLINSGEWWNESGLSILEIDNLMMDLMNL